MPTAEELLIEVLALDSVIHRTYPSTAVCWGGSVSIKSTFAVSPTARARSSKPASAITTLCWLPWNC